MRVSRSRQGPVESGRGEVTVLPGATYHSLPLTAPPEPLNDPLLDFLIARHRTPGR